MLIGMECVDGEGRRFVMAGAPLDLPVVERGKLSKHSREDAQVFSFLRAMAVRCDGDSPMSVLPGGDPPDRILVGASGRRWQVELTEMTLGRVRADLARVRAFGRRLQAHLEADDVMYGHLHGRRVMLTLTGPGGLPRDDRALFVDIAEALAADLGCWLDGVDVSNGLPDNLGTAGIYPSNGPMTVTMEKGGLEGRALVVATASTGVYPEEVLDAFRVLVAEKDKPANEVLVVTCGAPDELGYACGLDQVFLRFLTEAAATRTLFASPPRHVKAIVLHSWGTFDVEGITLVPGFVAPWNSPG